jgi:hypothetical protein
MEIDRVFQGQNNRVAERRIRISHSTATLTAGSAPRRARTPTRFFCHKNTAAKRATAASSVPNPTSSQEGLKFWEVF